MFRRAQDWFDSLKNKAVTVVVLVVVLTVAIATAIGTTVGQRELEAQARNQVATVSDILADSIDDKLEKRFDALSSVASSLSMNSESLSGRAQLILNRQIALNKLFDRLFLIDEDGLVLADTPEGSGVVGLNIKDRPYFQKTSQQLTTLISSPFLSRSEHKPIVVISAPILDFNGQLIAVLVGSIKLSADNFLGRISRLRVGKSGYAVVATDEGTVLAHPDPSRINTRLSEEHMNREESRADSEGQGEGAILTRNSNGEPVLRTHRGLNEAPWNVMVSLPLAEAFEPATHVRELLIWVALALIAIDGFLGMQFFRWLLAPIGSLAEQLAARQREHSALPVKATGGREIRQLAETFNRLSDERQRALDELAEREVFFRSLSESAPIGIVQTDILGRIEFTNPAFQNIMGLSAEAFPGRHLIAGVHEDDRRKVLAAWRDMIYEGKVFKGEYRLHDRQADRIIWVRTKTRLIETSTCVLGSVNIIRDITHELEIERELERSRIRAEGIIGALQEAVILTDCLGVIEFANAPAHSFLNAPERVIGRKLFDLISIRTAMAQVTLEDILQQAHVDSLDAVMARAGGTEMDIELTMQRLDPGETTEQLVFVLRDDSEKRRREQQLSWEATHDSLTWLANRRAFNDQLHSLVSAPSAARASSALLMIDLDYFKPVNDTGGHLVGDELLRALAAALLAGVRQTDFVARLGGDEFAVILPGCGIERALMIAETLRAGIADVVIEEHGQQYSVTASIGVTELTAEDTDPKAVIARADEAAYTAKAEGRNRVVRYR